MTSKTFAVVGGGLAGLSMTYYLIQSGISVDVFEKKSIGAGASGLAAGLLHGYAGAHARKNRFADESIMHSLSLLEQCSRNLEIPVYQKTGILRLALSEQQLEDFHFCAMQNPDVTWIDQFECQQRFPELNPNPGIIIHNGYLVDCPRYLKQLWELCQKNGDAKLIKEEFSPLRSSHYDGTVICAGAGSVNFSSLSQAVKLRRVKGQLLKFSNPRIVSPLPLPVNSKVYIVNQPNHEGFLLGATFERQFNDAQPDINKAKEELLPQALKLFPDLKECKLTDCLADLRISTPDHLPAIGKCAENTWYFTGLGSKGLLYHSLYAQKLLQSISYDLDL
ncbi:MAG: FAD-dependent oxidoreductase [Chlamydiales bacterium]